EAVSSSEGSAIAEMQILRFARDDGSEEHRLPIGAEHRFERRADLVQRRIASRRLENERKDVLRARRRFLETRQRFVYGALIALGTQLGHPLALRLLRGLADFQNGNAQLGLVGDELVDADDDAPMLLDLPLLARRRFGDLALEPSGLEPAHHTADLVD